MRIRRVWAGAAVLLALAAALLGRDAGSAALTPVTLQLKWLHQAQFGGYYVARERGFYRHEGLDVTILPGGPSIASESVVAEGRAQFGIDWLSALLVAREQGLPIVNIAQIFQASGMRLITFKSSGIKSVADFRGKRVGVWPSGNEYQFLALMEKAHLSPPGDFMTVVDQPFEVTPFLNGEIDVAHAMTYNELDNVVDQVGRDAIRVFDYNKLGVSVLEDGLFADERWLRENPQVAVRFLRASLLGWFHAVKDPRRAAEISFQYAGPDSPGGLAHQQHMAREVAKLIRYPRPHFRQLGYLDPAAFRRTWKILLKEGVLQAPPENAATHDIWRAAFGGVLQGVDAP